MNFLLIAINALTPMVPSFRDQLLHTLLGKLWLSFPLAIDSLNFGSIFGSSCSTLQWVCLDILL